MRRLVPLVVLLAACGPDRRSPGGEAADAATARDDAHTGAADGSGAGASDGGPATGDGGSATGDGGVTHDATAGVITGGPCSSGQPGATAYRVKWVDGGGTAVVSYEVDGLPDHSRDHAAAYGYQIGFTPSFVDPFLGDGGLQLDGSDFVDLELTTVGISSITSATLSILGRSYNTTASGSFTWQTFVDTGASPTDLVSNSAPYQWYSADMTSALAPGDAQTLIRIKAGPSSDALVVERIELCLQAS